jgi:hypothetical protein
MRADTWWRRLIGVNHASVVVSAEGQSVRRGPPGSNAIYQGAIRSDCAEAVQGVSLHRSLPVRARLEGSECLSNAISKADHQKRELEESLRASQIEAADLADKLEKAERRLGWAEAATAALSDDVLASIFNFRAMLR